jgi:hypothetical protein
MAAITTTPIKAQQQGVLCQLLTLPAVQPVQNAQTSYPTLLADR